MVLRDVELNYLEKWLPEASVKYKNGSPAVNLGLIITVFFKDGHTPDVRRRMVECVDRFYMEFKPYLKKTLPSKRWTAVTEKNYARQKQAILDSTPEEIFDWTLSSANESYLAPDYDILIMGKRIFHKDTDRSVIKLTFPLSLLKEPDGKARYEGWLLWLCNTFAVESGYAGLSFVLPYAFERMFPYEYALVQRFSGVMVDSIGTLEGRVAVNSLKGACWYTILGTPWLEKLGGGEQLTHRLIKTPEIRQLP
ncbi:type VI immunity family protein, partial [Cronobacter malonaticus]